MATERFSKQDFEDALSKILEDYDLHLSEVGLIGGEYRYISQLSDYVIMQINSSVASDGFAADTAENSIRVWLTGGDNKPLGNKTQRWVTRVVGWQERLATVVDKTVMMGQSIHYCNTCKTLEHVFVVKKDGRNHGRLFAKCQCDGSFVWLDETEQPEEESPACPKCGGAMVLRDGRKGQFWGCRQYPACKGTRDGEVKVLVSTPVAKPGTFVPSKYQLALFHKVQSLAPSENVVVEALAGSGKTTSIAKATELLPRNANIVVLVFNKHNVKPVQEKVPSWVKVCTYHSLGYAGCRKAFGVDIKVDEKKLDAILENVLNRDVYRGIFPVIKQLVSLVKANLIGTTEQELIELADYYGIETNGDSALIFQAVATCVARSVAVTNVVDFDDMCWLPVLQKVNLDKYDYVFVDECLPYYTPVLLANGSSLEIGKIVDDKLPVQVLSYNVNTGKQESCKVVGWSKIPNNKQLVKVKVKKLGKRVDTKSMYNFVVCTKDHKIWVKDIAYIEAGNLLPGMIVQVETSAYKSEKYKLSTKGKKVLSTEMTRKNLAGITGTYVPTSWSGTVGGNGRELPEPQKVLLEALGEGWIAEYAVSTKELGGRKVGYPTSYKIDIANPNLKIAVEVDGSSHIGRENLDSKKDNCLSKLGWEIWHIPNSEAILDLVNVIKDITSSDCIVDAEVVSIEPTYTKDWYVYDITVEDPHNFYANGILVHNCQDTNRNQIALALASVADGGHIIAVGDRFQSMYGFRGADANAIPNLIDALEATVLPLSITYRNPQCIVDLVTQKFPNIPLEGTGKAGRIVDVSYEQAMTMYQSGDMALCRTNAPLVAPVFELIRRGVKATIRGRDIGKGLITVIKKMKAHDVTELLVKLTDYKSREIAKLMATDKTSQAQNLSDKIETIIAIADGIYEIYDLENRIYQIFSDEVEGVVFSTIHKAKGLEAERVFILKPELLPHPIAKKEWEQLQEKNIEYVALTRTLSELVYVR